MLNNNHPVVVKTSLTLQGVELLLLTVQFLSQALELLVLLVWYMGVVSKTAHFAFKPIAEIYRPRSYLKKELFLP
jgi:hypothetical protein